MPYRRPAKYTLCQTRIQQRSPETGSFTPERPLTWRKVTISSKGTAFRLWRILPAVKYAVSVRLPTLNVIKIRY